MRRLRLMKRRELRREKMVLKSFRMKRTAKLKLTIAIIPLRMDLLTMLPLIPLHHLGLAAPLEGTALQGGGRHSNF
jgi:hypothetical protein